MILSLPFLVNCEFGPWSVWTQCSVSCGDGQHQRTRDEKQSTLYGGNNCSGDRYQTSACHLDPCPSTIFLSK